MNVQMKKGSIVANKQGGLFIVTIFMGLGYLNCTIHPIDDFSKKMINTGGGYLCLTDVNLLERFFVVGENDW